MRAIKISDDAYHLLEQRARALHRSPEDVLDDLVQKELSLNSVETFAHHQHGQSSYRVLEETLARQNFAIFQQRLPELLKEHAGEYAAMRHGEIVGFGHDKKLLWYQTRQQYGRGGILVVQVTEAPHTISLPFRTISKVR